MTLRDLIAEYARACRALDVISRSAETSDDRLESLGAQADILFEQIVNFEAASKPDADRKFLFISDYLAASAESEQQKRLLNSLVALHLGSAGRPV